MWIYSLSYWNSNCGVSILTCHRTFLKAEVQPRDGRDGLDKTPGCWSRPSTTTQLLPWGVRCPTIVSVPPHRSLAIHEPLLFVFGSVFEPITEVTLLGLKVWLLNLKYDVYYNDTYTTTTCLVRRGTTIDEPLFSQIKTDSIVKYHPIL